MTCHISEDPGQLRVRARLYWAVVRVEPEELFPSLSVGELGGGWWCERGETHQRYVWLAEEH